MHICVTTGALYMYICICSCLITAIEYLYIYICIHISAEETMQSQRSAIKISICSWESTSIPAVSKFYLWNSILLWANAHVSSIFVAIGQHPSNDHICRYGPPHPNFQILLRMQCPCKLCICCCWPIAIQNLCVHGDGNLSQLHLNFMSVA